MVRELPGEFEIKEVDTSTNTLPFDWVSSFPEYTKLQKTEFNSQKQNIVKDHLNGKTETECFESMFSMEMQNYILNETKRYANQKGKSHIDLSDDDMKHFYRLLLLIFASDSRKRSMAVSGNSKVFSNARYDGIGHWPAKRTRQQRCQGFSCKAKPLIFCEKCVVTLCIDCYNCLRLLPITKSEETLMCCFRQFVSCFLPLSYI